MNFIYIMFAIYFVNIFFGLKLLFIKNYNLSNMIYLMILLIILPFLTPIIYLHTFLSDNIRKLLYKKRKLDQIIFPNINNEEFYNNNEVTVFTNGDNLFRAIFDEIKKAKEYIHINFFTFNTDQIGKEMIRNLEDKLKENVEVIILYDRLGSFFMKKKYFKNFLKLGGELIPCLPLTQSYFLNINYRNHRKTIVVDNKISFIGGFNIGDNYLSRNKKMGVWVDSHLMIDGNATIEIEKRFLADYTYYSQRKIELNKYLITHSFNGNKKIQIISSGADVNKINNIENKFIEFIYKAKDYIYIQTPYLILNDSMTRALKYASCKGVRIKIMIPNKKDHPFVLEASKSYAKTLVSDTINVYLFNKNAFLHSKVFICDDYYLSIGTSNFDIRSFKYNLEINPFIYDKELALQAKTIFEKQLNYCSLLKLEKQSLLKTIKENLCKLLSTIL